MTASSFTDVYPSGNANDGNANTYWESQNNAFPQWLQSDLGTSTSVGRIVLKLPPASAWGTRTQTITVTSSTDGSNFGTVVGSAGTPSTRQPATPRPSPSPPERSDTCA
ncbi:discoidin domain-containing protein [Fodinicola feengrottensis]|uniref:discoidin domain-containing protein n=1 Tax=Fodinicola feengrottensis TaxID=435914 RepID=UPI0024422984|nr:discoidin domain-containing protein [Fodinicola feengrottensis]